jgi:FAD/FMN-containing dehydrogenase
MTPDLAAALGALVRDEALAPASTRELIDALQILASRSAALHRDVALSRARLDQIGRIEPRSGTVEAGAGIRLSVLEAALAKHGLSLGPMSPRASGLTLAELLEGPDAGVRAIPGGRLEPVCLACTLVLPDGRIHRTHPSPRSAAGPELLALALGGGGRLALVTEATLRCFPLPTTRKSQVFSFPSADAFVSAVRACLADGAWLESIRVELRADRAQVELRCLGTEDGVERDLATLGRRAFDVGGRPSGRLSGEFPIPDGPLAATEEREADWTAVRAAVAAGRPLLLSRLALSSVIARGEIDGVSMQRPAPWPAATAALAALIDPRGVLGGAP